MAITNLSKAISFIGPVVCSCLVAFLSACSNEEAVSEACYVRVGQDYCLPKHSPFTIENFSEDNIYGQALTFPIYSGGNGRVALTYLDTSQPWSCNVETPNVTVFKGTLQATCLKCEPLFKQFPQNFLAELRMQDGQEALFKPCHDLFSKTAENDQ